MTAPFYPSGAFGDDTGFLVIFFLGLAFGFFLERAGFGSARKLTSIFYFRDWAVLRVMFTAIVVAMIGVLYLSGMGLLEMEGVSVPATYLGAHVIGGLLLGIGFVVGGYCPGTSAVGAASGKLDALAYMAGLLAGTLLFGFGFDHLQWLYNWGSQGVVTLPEWMGVNTGFVGAAVVAIALLAFGATEYKGFVRGFRLSPAWNVVTPQRAGVAVMATLGFGLLVGYTMTGHQAEAIPTSSEVLVTNPTQPAATPQARPAAPKQGLPGVKRFKKGSSCS